MRWRFVTLDVFAGRRFAGNPLAVVLEAEGLDGDAVQTIAREFNLAETGSSQARRRSSPTAPIGDS